MDKYEKEIESYFDDIKQKCLEKYRLGREEHGGEPVNIDCRKEIMLEIYDIIIYFLIHKVNND